MVDTAGDCSVAIILLFRAIDSRTARIECPSGRVPNCYARASDSRDRSSRRAHAFPNRRNNDTVKNLLMQNREHRGHREDVG